MKKTRVIKIFLFALLLFASNIQSFAGDGFVIVRSKNFRFIGEISEDRIRREASKLEQFRESFRRAFPAIVGESSAPLTILIFKDAESFAPFKPVLENGSTDRHISGIFQSSGESNYIAFSISGNAGDEVSSETIFHEYIHFLFKKYFQTADLPVWLNEGLAEYFQTFRIKNERRAIFGEDRKNHLQLLRQYKIFPLKTLSEIDYATFSKTEISAKRLFYAQSWAVVYYLMRKTGGDLTARIENYLALIAAGKAREAAFEEAFKVKYSQAETELENYISRKSFEADFLDLSEKPDFQIQFSTEKINQSEWLFYLSDLLFQAQRLDEASKMLKKSLLLNEKSAAANLLFGKIFLRQKNPAEAISYFDKALALGGEKTAANFFLAQTLFRENVLDNGFVNPIPPENAKKIRELLKSAIRQNPQLIEAYQILTSISLTNNDEMSETIEYVENALKIQPQNFRLKYDLAQLYLIKRNLENARKIAAELAENCTEKVFCERVKSFTEVLNSTVQREKEIFELKKKYGLENVNFEEENLLPPAEAMNRALNRSLRKPLAGEKRFVGNLREIDCDKNVTFKIEGENQNLNLSKNSFDEITLMSFSSNTAGMRIECGNPKTEMFVVATYKINSNEKIDSDGEILVLEFVPKEFKLIE